jgi:hypothetical protein
MDEKVLQESFHSPLATDEGQENTMITGSEKKQEGQENMNRDSSTMSAEAQSSQTAGNATSISKEQASEGDHLTKSTESAGYQFNMLDVSQLITSTFCKYSNLQ